MNGSFMFKFAGTSPRYKGQGKLALVESCIADTAIEILFYIVKIRVVWWRCIGPLARTFSEEVLGSLESWQLLRTYCGS